MADLTILFQTIAIVWFSFQTVSGQGCVQLDACSCRDTHSGRLITLHPLANIYGQAAFTIGDSVNPQYTYRFNPCYKFSPPGEGRCNGVALCQTDASYNDMEFILGTQQSAVFNESNAGFLTLTYEGEDFHTHGGGTRVSTVYLVCDLNGSLGTSGFSFVREPWIGEYTFVLTSRCACPGGCGGPFPAVEKVQTISTCKPEHGHPWCGCRLSNNKKLLAISSTGSFRRQNVVASNNTSIFFNQCEDVNVPNGCEHSAVCLKTEAGDFLDFGQVKTLQFVQIDSDDNATAQFTSANGERKSLVRLICDHGRSRFLPPKLIVHKRTSTQSSLLLEAHTECACPGVCDPTESRDDTSQLQETKSKNAEKTATKPRSLAMHS